MMEVDKVSGEKILIVQVRGDHLLLTCTFHTLVPLLHGVLNTRCGAESLYCTSTQSLPGHTLIPDHALTLCLTSFP